MEFTTERLLLCEYRLTDLDATLRYEADPTVARYVCYNPFSREKCWEHQVACSSSAG